ncbi:MAG: squalene synthase HpnC [Phycisphaerales bacterium]|nr:squalene synthase HpnC [Phycisphaerales bacterium]
MSEGIVSQLDRWGPGHSSICGSADAAAYCRALTLGRYENFSVLSRLVPKHLEDGVCAVYAFCRWADDLGDEIADPEEAKSLLDWWRAQLESCFQGNASHPVYVALQPVIEQYKLDSTEFHHLIDAFVQDQHINRYQTWGQVVDYCTRSADPVGRLVLRLCKADRSKEQLSWSDAVCTGLQLANHWQDVQRDLLERNRIYLPMEDSGIDDFESRLIATVQMGHAPDPTFLDSYRSFIRTLVHRTRPLLEQAQQLSASLEPDVRPMISLFAQGGWAVLDLIEQSNCETALYRVRISKLRKAWLVWQATRQRKAS